MAETCDVCGRPLEAGGCWTYLLAEDPKDDLRHRVECYRLGYEREKARAKKAEAVTALADREWYGKLVAVEDERDRLRVELSDARTALGRAEGRTGAVTDLLGRVAREMRTGHTFDEHPLHGAGCRVCDLLRAVSVTGEYEPSYRAVRMGVR